MVSWWISHGVPLHAGMQVVSENVANDLRLNQCIFLDVLVSPSNKHWLVTIQARMAQNK